MGKRFIWEMRADGGRQTRFGQWNKTDDAAGDYYSYRSPTASKNTVADVRQLNSKHDLLTLLYVVALVENEYLCEYRIDISTYSMRKL